MTKTTENKISIHRIKFIEDTAINHFKDACIKEMECLRVDNNPSAFHKVYNLGNKHAIEILNNVKLK